MKLNPFRSRHVRCRKGHDWFPGHGSREFIITTDVCMRCEAMQVHLPYGTCMTGHPVKDHYDANGRLVPLAYCDAPM